MTPLRALTSAEELGRRERVTELGWRRAATAWETGGRELIGVNLPAPSKGLTKLSANMRYIM